MAVEPHRRPCLWPWHCQRSRVVHPARTSIVMTGTNIKVTYIKQFFKGLFYMHCLRAREQVLSQWEEMLLMQHLLSLASNLKKMGSRLPRLQCSRGPHGSCRPHVGPMNLAIRVQVLINHWDSHKMSRWSRRYVKYLHIAFPCCLCSRGRFKTTYEL